VKHSMIIVLMAAALVLAACGESDQEKAQTQVCDARADIRKEVDELRGLTLSTASVDGVTASLQAIRSSLGKIKDAQGNLNGERKQQVQEANQQFEADMRTIVQSLGGSLSLREGATQVKDATSKLADSYRQTLGRVDCS
jgi:major membrane immunogen (membrane-anchored lipoprotein)